MRLCYLVIRVYCNFFFFSGPSGPRFLCNSLQALFSDILMFYWYVTITSRPELSRPFSVVAMTELLTSHNQGRKTDKKNELDLFSFILLVSQNWVMRKIYVGSRCKITSDLGKEDSRWRRKLTFRKSLKSYQPWVQTVQAMFERVSENENMLLSRFIPPRWYYVEKRTAINLQTHVSPAAKQANVLGKSRDYFFI